MFGLLGDFDKHHALMRVAGFRPPDDVVVAFDTGWDAGTEWVRREREYMLFHRWLRTEREAIRAALL